MEGCVDLDEGGGENQPTRGGEGKRGQWSVDSPQSRQRCGGTVKPFSEFQVISFCSVLQSLTVKPYIAVGSNLDSASSGSDG